MATPYAPDNQLIICYGTLLVFTTEKNIKGQQAKLTNYEKN